MMMLINCSHCRTPLQLPPGAGKIRCAFCSAVTRVVAPSPNAPPGGPPASRHGRKKAVICGICYRYSSYQLKGSINDAKCMKHLLVNRFGFPEASIVMLTGDPSDASSL